MRALAIGLSLLLAAILALLGVFVARNKCRRDSLLRTQIAHPDVPVNLPHIHPNLWLGNVASARAADDLGFDHVVCVAYGDTCRASALGASRTYVDDTFPDSMGVPQEDFAGRVDRAADAIHAALEKEGACWCTATRASTAPSRRSSRTPPSTDTSTPPDRSRTFGRATTCIAGFPR